MLRKIWVIETFLNWNTEKMKENIKALVSGLLKENAYSHAHFSPQIDWQKVDQPLDIFLILKFLFPWVQNSIPFKNKTFFKMLSTWLTDPAT